MPSQILTSLKRLCLFFKKRPITEHALKSCKFQNSLLWDRSLTISELDGWMQHWYILWVWHTRILMYMSTLHEFLRRQWDQVIKIRNHALFSSLDVRDGSPDQVMRASHIVCKIRNNNLNTQVNDNDFLCILLVFVYFFFQLSN